MSAELGIFIIASLISHMVKVRHETAEDQIDATTQNITASTVPERPKYQHSTTVEVLHSRGDWMTLDGGPAMHVY